MAGNENKPSASVTTSRLNPVSVWMALTVAPGRTPPLESLTVPLICAVAWARPVAGRATSRPPHNRQLRTYFMASLLVRGVVFAHRTFDRAVRQVFPLAVLLLIDALEPHIQMSRLRVGRLRQVQVAPDRQRDVAVQLHLHVIEIA